VSRVLAATLPVYIGVIVAFVVLAVMLAMDRREHLPVVKPCPRGLYTASCTCSWFVNVKHATVAGALTFYAERHGYDLVESE
jgi:uncharacterized membrane protein (UPF0136 family)